MPSMRKPREYNTANQLVATRTYSSPSPFSSLVPLAFNYFCYNSLGQRTLAVEDMNRNGQIDWSEADRVVSNDVQSRVAKTIALEKEIGEELKSLKEVL